MCFSLSSLEFIKPSRLFGFTRKKSNWTKKRNKNYQIREKNECYLLTLVKIDKIQQMEQTKDKHKILHSIYSKRCDNKSISKHCISAHFCVIDAAVVQRPIVPLSHWRLHHLTLLIFNFLINDCATTCTSNKIIDVKNATTSNEDEFNRPISTRYLCEKCDSFTRQIKLTIFVHSNRYKINH